MARVSIEDCLHQMPNRFALVTVAAHRTRQLMEGQDALIKTKNKLGVTALREIAEGLIEANESLDKLQEDARAESVHSRDHFEGFATNGATDAPAADASGETAAEETVSEESAVEAPADEPAADATEEVTN